LGGIFDVGGEEDGAGAGAENGAAFGGELADRVEEAFFLKELKLRGAFAAGEDESVGLAEIGDGADFEGLGAECLENGGVCGEVALDGEDADDHGEVISFQFSVFSFLVFSQHNARALAGLKPGTYKSKYGRKNRVLTRKKRGFGMTNCLRLA
jgi:hypothetical protein